MTYEYSELYIHAHENQGASGANRMRRSEVSGEEHMCICGQIFAPVCGSDGVWYDNKCLMVCNDDSKKGDIWYAP
ncbi:hypothetical protein DPMN_104366 [Dreissena polymorpha]|uniref:Kazal-like domain-containing protein n=1 Tax=Dreissena polymorpha TaxID=45954 RepID=A0A9D4HCZ2_DREPO|nr:hypothetical protein DPMN_104366 [Dreissena polymorpha]